MVVSQLFMMVIGGNIAIYDGTNSTRARRKMITDRISYERRNSNLGLKVSPPLPGTVVETHFFYAVLSSIHMYTSGYIY